MTRVVLAASCLGLVVGCGAEPSATDAGHPVDAPCLVFACRTPCDPWDLDAPCAPYEVCVALDSTFPSEGTCRDARMTLPRLGESCADHCASGLVCVPWTCMERCDPDGTNPDPLARCSAGTECTTTTSRPFCAPPCDPSAGPAACDTGSYCAPSPVPGGAVTHCLPLNFTPWSLDEPCGGNDCDSGLVCSNGAHRRCRPYCDPTHPCADGEYCFAAPDPLLAWGLADWGSCDRPCTPGSPDACATGWCEPRELDAAGTWIGSCAY